MKRAKSLGIDAFALNIGVDPYTDRQLQFAYDCSTELHEGVPLLRLQLVEHWASLGYWTEDRAICQQAGSIDG